ncbi:MAG: hypothetical protein U0835_16550 [Isosphaeraceae bacterium]
MTRGATDWRAAIDACVDRLDDELRGLRRHLHAHPEPSREEFDTARLLAERLGREGLSVRMAPSGRDSSPSPTSSRSARASSSRAPDIDALGSMTRRTFPTGRASTA